MAESCTQQTVISSCPAAMPASCDNKIPSWAESMAQQRHNKDTLIARTPEGSRGRRHIPLLAARCSCPRLHMGHWTVQVRISGACLPLEEVQPAARPSHQACLGRCVQADRPCLVRLLRPGEEALLCWPPMLPDQGRWASFYELPQSQAHTVRLAAPQARQADGVADRVKAAAEWRWHMRLHVQQPGLPDLCEGCSIVYGDQTS